MKQVKIKYTLRTIGIPSRYITSYEKNTIAKLDRLINVKKADLTYEKSRLAKYEHYCLSLQITYDSNNKITVRAKGNTPYEALIRGIKMVETKLLKNNSKPRHSVINFTPMTMHDRAV